MSIVFTTIVTVWLTHFSALKKNFKRNSTRSSKIGESHESQNVKRNVWKRNHKEKVKKKNESWAQSRNGKWPKSIEIEPKMTVYPRLLSANRLDNHLLASFLGSRSAQFFSVVSVLTNYKPIRVFDKSFRVIQLSGHEKLTDLRTISNELTRT